MIRGWIVRWVLNILALILTALLLGSNFELTVWAAIVGSVFLGVVNAFIRPILIGLTLPLNIVTLGLFTFVINGFLLWITSVTVRGFDIAGFGWAILAAIVMSIISGVISFFIDDRYFNFR
ncbi:MAG: phage holin family protein [Syntrophomonas sp.]